MSESSSDNQAPKKRERSSLLEGVEIKKLIEFGLNDSDENGDAIPVIPGYEVIKPVGQGGMGRVFLCKQLSLNREVAIKVISVEGISRSLMLDRLEREARTMAKLSHPNLVRVFDFIALNDQNSAIVMEWIDGGTLQISPTNPRPVDETRRIGTQIAACLAAAHKVGVIHRDIKPSNLIVDSRGDIRVTDFGLALDRDASDLRLTASGAAVGTLGYIAPEQLRGDAIDHRADLYSLGVVLYELLVGKLPVGNFQTAGKNRPEVPKLLDNLISSLLQPRPEDRPQTAREVLAVLEQTEELSPSRRTGLKATIGIVATAGAGFGIWSGVLGKKKLKPKPPNLLEGKVRTLYGSWVPTSQGYRSRTSGNLLGASREPLDLPAQIRVSFTRQLERHVIAVFFQHPNGFGGVELSTYRNDLGGLQMIDGMNLEKNTNSFVYPIKNGQRYVLDIMIDKNSVQTFIDGESQQIEHLQGRKLTLSPDWKWDWDPIMTDGWTIMLGTYYSQTLFHSVEVI